MLKILLAFVSLALIVLMILSFDSAINFKTQSIVVFLKKLLHNKLQ